MLYIVTGLPRSGTSMMMQMLAAGGLPLVYGSRKADEFNPGGYWEHPDAIAGVWSDEQLAAWDGHAIKMLASVRLLPRDRVRAIIMRRDWASISASANRVVGEHKVNPADISIVRTWAAGVPHCEVWYDEVLADPVVETLRVTQTLFPDWDREHEVPPLDLAAMAAAVRPEWRTS